jgi:pimeloyl-ACP methyl ester carboxylesterase
MAAAVAAARSPAGRRLLRGPEPIDALPPVPSAALPPATIIALPGRGEVFFRDTGLHGTAIPVILLHGWTATADVNFLAAYGPLSLDRRVIALDHRGHGRGMRSEQPFTLEDCADDAAGLLEVLGITRAVAVGYSMGGPVAMLLAQRHPDLVAGLVVQATALEWSGEWRERARWRSLALMELAIRMGTGESIVARVLRDITHHRPELLPLRPWLASEFRRGDAAAITQAGRALASYDGRPWASSLGLPAVSVVTSRDRMVPPHKQRTLATALRADVIELDADHDAPLMEVEAYGEATRKAVAAVAAAADG